MPLGGAGYAAEVGLVVVSGPVVVPVGLVTGRVDRGEAAPPPVDHMARGGEREVGQPETGLSGRHLHAEGWVPVMANGTSPGRQTRVGSSSSECEPNRST